MNWEEYARRVTDEWRALLTSQDSTDESRLHVFLERHPSLVPGAFSFPPSGHYPFPGALISKPPLKGVGEHIPDFMWIAVDSGTVYPVFVEIETPLKRWFTKGGQQHAELTQALTQLASWRAWIGRGENMTMFLQRFEVPDTLYRHRTIRPQFVLIHGSQREFEDRPELNRLRDQLESRGAALKCRTCTVRPSAHSFGS